MSEGLEFQEAGFVTAEEVKTPNRLRLAGVFFLLALATLFDPKIGYEILALWVKDEQRKERLKRMKALCLNCNGSEEPH